MPISRKGHGAWTACGEPLCCPAPAEVRRVLDLVAHHLPRADARRFLARVAALDDLW